LATTEHSLVELTRAGLDEIDPEIARLCDEELERQRDQLELIASENFTWPSVLEAVGSVLTNKYAEGQPGRRYYGGCEVVDEVERIAIERARSLFGAEHANVQPHSGASANMAAYYALLEPGDVVLGMRLDHGGHLTHGLKVNFSGRTYRFVGYGVSRETEQIDFDEVLRLAREHRPALIVAGGSAYPREIDARRFREIADEVGARLMVDMAHFSGLVAAGEHQNPVESADVVTSTTHKTLAGPRAGFILCREEHATAIDRAVFPGLQGGPLCHATAAKAVCFRIAASEAFRIYQRQVRANAVAIVDGLAERGERCVSGGTDTHLVQLDLRRSELTGKDAEDRLHEVLMTVNRNTVPFDERPPTVASGVRIGSPAGTMRGLDEDDFREVGRIIGDAVKPAPEIAALAERTREILRRRPLYPGLASGHLAVRSHGG
jgi:glycine hydroxymethyltransferase